MEVLIRAPSTLAADLAARIADAAPSNWPILACTALAVLLASALWGHLGGAGGKRIPGPAFLLPMIGETVAFGLQGPLKFAYSR